MTERRALHDALYVGASGPPRRYVIWRLAEMWGTPPWVIEEDAPADWIYQGLEMMAIEADVRAAKMSRG